MAIKFCVTYFSGNKNLKFGIELNQVHVTMFDLVMGEKSSVHQLLVNQRLKAGHH